MSGAVLLERQLPAQPPLQLPAQLPAQTRKVLMVVAHPGDEYAFAANTYRMVRELGWAADQVIVTNGDAGYRYSAPAEAVYGVALLRKPAIRKEEAVREGKILGHAAALLPGTKGTRVLRPMRHPPIPASSTGRGYSAISELLARDRDDAVFTLLPAAETHGHHRAATLLAWEAVARLPHDQRPATQPLTATVNCDPVFVFDRTASFGYRNALNYQIVVNWVIAEHKSEGLFQKDSGVHELEQFWPFGISGDPEVPRLPPLACVLVRIPATAER